MSKRIAIIGGGLSGIAAAVNLCQFTRVHLFESTPHLGGRVRSFYDKDFSCHLDNGMHLMIGAYEETYNLLDTLGSADKVEFMSLDITFHFPRSKKKTFRLRSNKLLPGPLHLFLAILKSGIFNIKEWLGLIRLVSCKHEGIDQLSAIEWLKKYHQSNKSIEYFWRPLILATLNAEPENAIASNLMTVLKMGFFKGWKASCIVFPKKPFAEIFSEPAIHFMKKNSAIITLGKPVKNILKENGLHWLFAGNKKYGPFHAVVLALPKTDTNRLLKEKMDDFTYSPISSFYFRISGKGLPTSPVNALLESKLHWLFYLSDRNLFSVTSSASDLDLDSVSFEMELKKLFPGTWQIIHFKRIVSQKATPLLTPGNKRLRKALNSDQTRFIVGDWTETGLPATIEGAIRSGKSAAEKIRISL